MRRIVTYVALAVTLVAPALRAQCSDGSQPRVVAGIPQCGAARTAAVRAPALDERTWVVVPFNVQSPSPDVAWLKDGSVTLLNQDLAQWQDVRVVDDKRVADYLRDVPSVRSGKALSLNDGLAVARRAGAARLVMGELLKLGNVIRVSASVFDVRRGTQLRAAQEQAAAQDSLPGAFGRMTRRLLNLPAPEGVNLGNIGTARIDAYQEYVAGVKELNRFAITEARQHFERALALDSSFALAHYKITIASLYDDADETKRILNAGPTMLSIDSAMAVADTFRARHSAAAARLAGTLPNRERGLISGLAAQLRRDYEKSCAAYGALVAADSNDVEAIYGLAECLRRDDMVLLVPTDTTRVYYRTSWNTALRLYRRAIAVDPTFHLAFAPIVSLLTATTRPTCRAIPAASICDRPNMLSSMRDTAAVNAFMRRPRFTATVRFDGDSLVTTAVTVRPNALADVLRPAAAGPAVATRRPSLERALAAAREWVDAGPNEPRAHKTFGRFLLRLGRYAEAQQQFQIAASQRDDPESFLAPIEVAIKLGRSAEAARMLDTFAIAFGSGMGRFLVAQQSVLFGRVAGYEAAQVELARGALPAGTPVTDDLLASLRRTTRMPRIILGMSPDTVLATERAMLALMGARGCTVANFCLFSSSPVYGALSFGLALPRTEWPALSDSVAKDALLAPAVALSRHDTVALRASARRLDSLARARVAAYLFDDGSAFVATEAHLVLGDTASALADLDLILGDLMARTGIDVQMAANVPASYIWPRALLLRADLRAAKGQKAEARADYRRFVDLWARADPEFQPIVARARQALASLGG